MINTKNFIERLEKIIAYYGLSASSFAEKIGVQRSSISHILSGRNKPSLEFIMKILSSFPEVDLYWLLNGKGAFPSDKLSEPIIGQSRLDLSSSVKTVKPTPTQTPPEISSSTKKEIVRIVILYEDGTFESFEP